MSKWSAQYYGIVRVERGETAQRGFTLIELMSVIAIILILATISGGHYQQSVIRAKEATLHTDLKVMREAIQRYTEDKEAAPSSLDDLVTAHYIQQIPTDPFTMQKTGSPPRKISI